MKGRRYKLRAFSGICFCIPVDAADAIPRRKGSNYRCYRCRISAFTFATQERVSPEIVRLHVESFVTPSCFPVRQQVLPFFSKMAEEQDDEIQALKAIYDADFAGM